MDYRDLRKHWSDALPATPVAGGGRLIRASDVPEPPSPHQHGMWWGDWQFDAKTLTLVHRDQWYDVDLAACMSSAQVLDRIVHIAKKSWCTAEDIHCLIDALTALLNPQAHICSMGVDHTFDARRFLKEQTEAHEPAPPPPGAEH